jgi:rhodanese-related sulfurtransferase
MKEITVQEFKQKIDNQEEFQLIDVREEHEYDICNLNGELMPVGEIFQQVERISKEKMVILYCRSGSRSMVVGKELEKRHGFTNLYNLKGGIIAYAREIDPGMPVY